MSEVVKCLIAEIGILHGQIDRILDFLESSSVETYDKDDIEKIRDNAIKARAENPSILSN